MGRIGPRPDETGSVVWTFKYRLKTGANQPWLEHAGFTGTVSSVFRVLTDFRPGNLH